MKQIWIYFVAIFLTFLIMRQVLGNVWYPMHDTTHVARLYLMDQTIGRGEYPPIWAEGINNGLGYPLFHFYAPLFYQVASAFSLLLGYFGGLKLALSLFIFFGLVGMMRLVAPLGRGAMLLSAVLLSTSPYIAVDLYVRGAFSEIAALFLFPLVLACWQDLTSKKRQVLAGAAMAFFVMSHNLIPMLAFPIIALYLLYHHRKNLVTLIFPSLITVLLSGGYLLPLFFERDFVQADQIAKTSNYALHFVMPSQLWNSTWGFGGSAEGIEDGMSFKLGKIQLLLAILGGLWCIFKSKKSLIFPIFALFTLFMATPYSSIVWDKISFLQLAQFPWRYLALSTSLLAITGAFALSYIRFRLLRVLLVLVTTAMLFFLNLKYFTPQTKNPANLSEFTSAKYLDTVSDIIPEYMPRYMAQKIEGELPTFTHKDGTTTIGRAYYPTWKVMLDGKEVKAWPSEKGLLTISNEKASENITFTQKHTNLEIIGYILTLVGATLTLYWLIKK